MFTIILSLIFKMWKAITFCPFLLFQIMSNITAADYNFWFTFPTVS